MPPSSEAAPSKKWVTPSSMPQGRYNNIFQSKGQRMNVGYDKVYIEENGKSGSN